MCERATDRCKRGSVKRETTIDIRMPDAQLLGQATDDYRKVVHPRSPVQKALGHERIVFAEPV